MLVNSSDKNKIAENVGSGEGEIAAASADATGFKELLGFEVIDSSKDYAVIGLELKEGHLNRNGYVHGGVIMSLLDSACGHAGVYCDVPGNVRRCITISMNTTFIKPARDGTLRTEARVIGRGRKIFFVEATVFDGSTLVATATGTFRYVAGGEDERGVPIA
jgi:uncharacterized protein (TIGR00369 family)